MRPGQNSKAMQWAWAWLAVFALCVGCEQSKEAEQRPASSVIDARQGGASGDNATDPLPPAPAGASHPIAAHEIEMLRRQGLENPIQDIVEDLKRHPEVIPHSGVVGGKFGFYDPDGIRVLNRRWVYARFDDGHMMGSGVFEFAIQPDRSMTWKVVSSSMDP